MLELQNEHQRLPAMRETALAMINRLQEENQHLHVKKEESASYTDHQEGVADGEADGQENG
eukprot:7958863-Karenia_brevis.AAC.1